MAEATGSRILIIEDEARVADFVARSLSETGYQVETAATYSEGLRTWLEIQPDMVVLDLTLPDGDGLELLQTIRQSGGSAPVLVLSAKASLSERVTGLDAGADDYLGKPFGIEELLARVRVLLRRKDGSRGIIHCENLVIDTTSRRVTRSGRVVFLSETEYRLLELLAIRLRQTVPKREILTQVWDDAQRDDNLVEVYIRYLRTKLEFGGAKRLVQTVRGQGYMLSEDDGT